MNLSWHEAGPVNELPENKIVEKKIEGKLIAFSAICPHGGAKFCEGWTDYAGNVVCPLHQYKFNPSNGYNASGEGYKLKTFPVEIRDNIIYIGINN
jgi:nitrite reductase/ring-hydroxylating ferredoxin subunit